jgi:ribosomal-protein-alanine N-acetyltransferase
MTAKREKRSSLFVIVWEFRVRSNKRAAFEKAYSPDGVWTKLFRHGEGYIRTELIRDCKEPQRYLTIDVWVSRRAYERFKKQNRAKYQAIDKECDSLTQSEKLIGEFQSVGQARASQSEVMESPIPPALVSDKSPAALIRAATSEDVAAIFALERSIPSAAHWPETTYRSVFDPGSPRRIALVAVHEHRQTHRAICGFVLARVVGGDCELENIFVAPQNQHGGLGSQLLQSLATAARSHNASRIFLEVRESNGAARALYEKSGFAITGRRPAYYTDPTEDAVLYALQL